MVNVAVVGCGYWGPNLVRNINSLSEARVTKLCDVEAERLAHMRTLYSGIRTTTDFGDLVKDREVHAIVVATPVAHHYELGKQSLEAGKHTFIEKPLAATVAEGEALVELAKAKDLTLMVGHTFLYSPAVRKIKELVERRALGDILYVSARRLNLGLFQKDINVAWDLAPHDISIILHVLDVDPISVNCQGKAHVNPEIEDVTNISLNFSNGGFATIQSSWLDPNKVREMTFVGEKRMLVYDDVEANEKIRIYDKRVDVPPHYDSFAEFHYSYHYGDMYAPYLKQFEPLREEMRHFLECLSNGTKCISGGAEGLQVLRILEAASRSLKNGGGKIPVVATELPSKHDTTPRAEGPAIKGAERLGFLGGLRGTTTRALQFPTDYE
jgi:predicted dehydrogenase